MSRLQPSGNISASPSQPAWALFNLAFRPFFLFGAIFSIIAVVIWGGILTGKIALNFYGGQMWWHIHEMLFGFIGAIVVGFLLTAVQNWSGIKGLSGLVLTSLFLVWLLGRITLFFPNTFPHPLIATIDILFLPIAAIALSLPIIKAKLWRNLMFIPILLAMTCCNVFLHKAVLYQQPHLLYTASSSMIFLIVLLMCILGGRVFPMFTANGTQTPKVAPIKVIEILSILSVVIIVLINLSPFIIVPEVKAALFFFTALIHAIRAFRWRIWVTFKTPLVWSLHISYWCIALGFLLLGLSEVTDSATRSQGMHTLTIGAMSAMILSMISRVSLGHTGRMIIVGKIMSIAFLSIFTAFFVRVFASLFINDFTQVIYLTVTLWVIAFGIFVWKYTPILMTPRIDGKPG